MILSLNGKPIQDSQALQAVVAQLPLDQAVKMDILRDRKFYEATVTIREQPKKYGTIRVRVPRKLPPGQKNALKVEKLGLSLIDLTESLAKELGYVEGTRGVMVASVEDRSIAGTSLPAGTMILQVERQPVSSSAECKRIVEQASLQTGILVQTYTPQSGTGYVLLKSKK